MNKKAGIPAYWVDFAAYFILFWVVIFFYITIPAEDSSEKTIKAMPVKQEYGYSDNMLISVGALSALFGEKKSVADVITSFPQKFESDPTLHERDASAQAVHDYINDIVKTTVDAGRLPCTVYYKVGGQELYYAGDGFRESELQIKIPMPSVKQYLLFSLYINCPEAQR